MTGGPPGPAAAGPPARDRRQLLLAGGATLNGIDYVEVAADQINLTVHFLNPVPMAGSLALVDPVTITGGEVVTSLGVVPIDEKTAWGADDQGRPVLSLTVTAPGDFSTYRLTLSSTKLDPFFDWAAVDFKVGCADTLDCAQPAPASVASVGDTVPIDYLAKDFGSFSRALSEFSALHYPRWVERSEADLGMVLLQALAALADELSYYQDRVAAESTLGSATQRLSVVRHARLVDYEPAPATTATAVLQLDVSEEGTGAWTIDTPLLCRALGADGSIVDFEVEDPQVGMAGAIAFTVDARWNRVNLVPYWWDDSQRCLAARSSDFYLVGQGLGLGAGQQLLLDSPGPDSADAPVRELVTVSSVVETADPLVPAGSALTHVFLAAPTTEDHDLWATEVAGNIVTAVQGIRVTEQFVIPGGEVPSSAPTSPSPAPAVVRLGADSTALSPVPSYRWSLAQGPLAWIATGEQDVDTTVPALPELVLGEVVGADEPPVPWTFGRWLLDAGPTDQVFTLTPEQYSPVLTAQGTTWFDYDGDGGTTIRFGDGSTALSPPPGTVFEAQYRVGGGAAGNVPADTIVSVAPGQPQGPVVTACTNPFPATGGQDAETIAQVRVRAPQQFAAVPRHAVLASDYATAAQTLPWVDRAGASFRWTGSWLSVLTCADPEGAEEPTAAQLSALTQLLDEQRLAGSEVYVVPPHYASIDVQVTVDGSPSAFASDVASAVLARLSPGARPGGATGFFDHDNWSFGQALESSTLFAAVQSCPGVDGVASVHYRQRGVHPAWEPLPETVDVGPHEILRVDNDPSRPEAGTLQVIVEGSK
jgi:hypothetical protein